MSLTTVEIEGMDAVMSRIRKLPDKVKRREVLKLLRRQAKPIIRGVRAAAPQHASSDKHGRPIPDEIRRYKYGKKGSRGRKPGSKGGKGSDTSVSTTARGDMQKSIKSIAGRKGGSKTNPVLYVGPKLSKRDEGWRAWFVINGTKYQPPNDFIVKGGGPLLPMAAAGASKELKKYIINEAKKIKLRT